MKTTPQKKTLSPDLEEEVYVLWSQQDKSYQEISEWLLAKHEFSASREWVRRLLEKMKLAKGGVPDDGAEPEDLDEDQQLLKLQCDAYKEARRQARKGETHAFTAAVKAHVQVVLARKRLKEEVGPGTTTDTSGYQQLMPGVEVPDGRAKN